jgi:DNA-binding response OmpR family regulator
MKELPIEIEAHYPKQAVAGATYTMKADLSFDPEKINWPFRREEIPIYCMISTSLFTIKYPENPIFLLHRYGGTYGKLTFFLKAVSEKKSGEVTIILLNDGMPVGHVDLKSEIIEIDVDKVKKIESEEKVGLSRQKQHKVEEKYVVLLVEENKDLREFIRNTLEPLYTVLEANDGKEGIAKAKEIIPDLIISEIMIPEKDEKTGHIPIIFLTNKASEESIIKGFEVGADDYITKPFNTQIFLIRIKNLIDLGFRTSEISMSSIDEKFLNDFKDIIEKNLSDPDFTIDILCEKLGIGRSTLFNKIMALTGETPNQFIMSYRLERGAQLLREGFGNVTEVAMEVGFESATYFSKCFKERFHQSPSSFKTFESEQKVGISSKEQTKDEGKNVILVVEDNSAVRQYIRDLFEPSFISARVEYGKAIISDEEGYEVESMEKEKEIIEPSLTVVEASDGKEGIKKALEIVPDLIISDILMPEMDGYELCRKLKKNIKTWHIPIIFLTAKASEESIIEGLQVGAADYVTKPFNTKILLARVKNLIELHRHLRLKIQRHKIFCPSEISVSSKDQEFIKELHDIIERNLSDPDFTIDELCKKLGVGRVTLFKKIKALTGENPNQFIMSYRLERGAQLLRAGFGNVTEVAFEVGFNSVSYFSKCFKEKFHCSPSSYMLSESKS